MSGDLIWKYDDGGRASAGFRGDTGDCVTRAIAIATGLPYIEVYDALNRLAKLERPRKRKRSAARTGVYRTTYQKYLAALGWRWVPCMKIGQGCRVHLVAAELPGGRLIVRLSGHLSAICDGTIRDTWDPRRGPTFWYTDGVVTHVQPDRCVYGYWQPPQETA